MKVDIITIEHEYDLESEINERMSFLEEYENAKIVSVNINTSDNINKSSIVTIMYAKGGLDE